MLLLFIVDARRDEMTLRGVSCANHWLGLVDVGLVGGANYIDNFDEASVEDVAHFLKLLFGNISGT
jgi:hypothetical protein